MPIYEYQCSSCEKIHEVMQKFSDAPMAECPECKGSVSKIMSSTSFALKGSGWYSTDYKTSGKAEVKPAPKAESKPAPKAESKA